MFDTNTSCQYFYLLMSLTPHLNKLECLYLASMKCVVKTEAYPSVARRGACLTLVPDITC